MLLFCVFYFNLLNPNTKENNCFMSYFHPVCRTPLMLAVLNGHTECVYSLLSQGASVENQDRWGRTALHRGVRHSHIATHPLTLLFK